MMPLLLYHGLFSGFRSLAETSMRKEPEQRLDLQGIFRSFWFKYIVGHVERRRVGRGQVMRKKQPAMQSLEGHDVGRGGGTGCSGTWDKS